LANSTHRTARAVTGISRFALMMYREMDMRFWLEKAEAELKELG